jgi:DNA polymerase elongation subunit (family B)
MSSNVLDGFDKTEGVVGIIIENNKEILYFADGSKTEKPMQLFTLAAFPGLYSKQGKLKGGLYYQYAYVFDKVSVFNSFVKNNRDVIKTYRDLIQNTMVSRGMRMYKGLELTRLNILSWDIETTGLDPRAPDAKVIMITNTFENSKGEIIRKLFSFDEYEHEGEMIRAWCRWVQEINPDIILGHNIYSFDIPYMIERAANFGTKLFLGR